MVGRRIVVEGDDPELMHQQMAATVEDLRPADPVDSTGST